MPDVILLAKGSAAAAGLAAAVFLILSWPWRIVSPMRRIFGSVAGAAAGFMLGCWILGVRAKWPATEVEDRWLLVLFPAIVLIKLLAAAMPTFPRAIRLWRFAVAGGTMPILLYKTIYLVDLPGVSREWPPPKAAFILTGMALAIVAAWGSLVVLARRSQAPTVALSVAFTCLGSGLTIMLSGYATGGQIGLPLATAVGGVALVSLVLARPVDLTGLLGVAVINHVALLLSGYFFAELKLTNALMLAVAPQLGWLAEIPLLRRAPSAVRGVVRTLPVVLLTGAALVLAQQKFVEDSASPSVDSAMPSLDDYSNFGK